MPDYAIQMRFVDENSGRTTREYYGEFADDAAASTAAAALLVDMNAATDTVIIPVLKRFDAQVGAVVAGSNVFENARVVVLKNDGEEYPLDIPSPVNGIFVTGTNDVNITSALVTDLLANFGASGWKISDGEYPVAPRRGKRVFVRSGKTNLR